MTGQDAIISLRRQGFAPAFVRVDDWQHDATDDGVTVSLSPADVPERQDWRFVVGLPVLVAGEDAGRIERIVKACGAYAKRVIASTFAVRPDVVDYRGGPVKHIVRITDTAGAFTWQA